MKGGLPTRTAPRLENNDPKSRKTSRLFFDDVAAYFYICPNDTVPIRTAHDPELDILLRNTKKTTRV